MNEIYRKLTGIDIEEQKRIWDERGMGYWGEFLVFCELYQNLPGVCKILMNLEIPVYNGKTTEVDLLLIHETGLYAFEMKHFKGDIYGKMDEANWTQYFKTTSNQKFMNPVRQNQYHIANIRKRYPGIPVHSFIVFTNDECKLHLEGTISGTTICKLRGLVPAFLRVSNFNTPVCSMDQIDALFNEMKEFSHIMNEQVAIDGVAVPFYQYVGTLAKDFKEKTVNCEKIYQKKVQESETFYLKKVKACERKTRIAKWWAAAACGLVVCILLGCYSFAVEKCDMAILAAEQEALVAQAELAKFAKKFEHVEDVHIGEIQISKDLILAKDVILKKSTDLENSLDLSCCLVWNGTEYGVVLSEDAKIIVMLKDGVVKEYNLWNNVYPFIAGYRLGPNVKSEGQMGVHKLYGISVDDISYIKLINLGVWHKVNYSIVELDVNYEVELYNITQISNEE